MRRFCMYGIIMIILVMFSGHHESAQGGIGPRLVMKEEMHDFGKVWGGDVVEYSFKVFNKGDEPLLIGRVKPG